jgi:hypothetical protein
MSEIDLLKEIKKIQRELDILKCFDVPDAGNSVWDAIMKILTQNGDLLYLENIPLVSNTVSPSGILSYWPAAVEYILTGCDLTLADFTATITIDIDLWLSGWSQAGLQTIRLRRDSLTGAILETWTWTTGMGGGSQLGHQHNVLDTYIDAAPTTGHYVLTVEESNVLYTIYSDTRGFDLSGTVASSLKALHIGTVGQVLTVGADGKPYWA